MDPVSALGGVQTAFTFAKALKSYIDDVRGAPEDIKKLVDAFESTFFEISELEMNLRQNEYRHNWDEFGELRARKCINEGSLLLQKFGQLFLKTGATFDPLKVGEAVNTGIWSKASWTWYKQEFQVLRNDLNILMTSVNMAKTQFALADNPALRTPVAFRELARQERDIFKLENESTQIRGHLLSLGQHAPRRMPSTQGSPEAQRGITGNHEPHGPPDVSDIEADKIFKSEDVRAQKLVERMRKYTERKLLNERKAEEAAVAQAKAREQEARKKFIDQINTENKARNKTHAEVTDLLKTSDVPPKQREALADQLVESLRPQSDEFREAKSWLIAKEMMPSSTAEQGWPLAQLSRQQQISSRWWNRRESQKLDVTFLSDRDTSDGRAVLTGSFFLLELSGACRHMLVDPSEILRKCQRQIAKGDSSLTSSLSLLPTSCQAAIESRRAELSQDKEEYDWALVLIEPTYHPEAQRFFRRSMVMSPNGPFTGAYALFKRCPRVLTAQRQLRPLAEGEDQTRAQTALGRLDDRLGQLEPNLHGPNTASKDVTSNSRASLRRPIFPKVHRDHVAIATLQYYDLPWIYDPNDPEYFIIKQEMSPHETDILFEHTRRLRKKTQSLEMHEPDDSKPRSRPSKTRKHKSTAQWSSPAPDDSSSSDGDSEDLDKAIARVADQLRKLDSKKGKRRSEYVIRIEETHADASWSTHGDSVLPSDRARPSPTTAGAVDGQRIDATAPSSPIDDADHSARKHVAFVSDALDGSDADDVEEMAGADDEVVVEETTDSEDVARGMELFQEGRNKERDEDARAGDAV